MWKRTRHRDMADVNQYTARRLNEMARSLEILARSCQDPLDRERRLTREDALAAMQMSAAMVCGDCSRCNLYQDSEKEDSYYLYYLLRAFEQKGQVDFEDMPRFFMETCRHREDYLGQLNRHLGRATMNLEWKNRFLESRDTVMTQFRELAVMLEEFAHQVEQARDITGYREEAVRKLFRLHHMAVENQLLLQHESRQREAYLTVKTTDGRCRTAREAADLLGQALGGSWYALRDSRTLVTRRPGTLRFLEAGSYRVMAGTARQPRNGEAVSGDSFTCSTDVPGQVVLSLSDGMGSGGQAEAESRRVVELIEQLLEAGFSARASLKMVNTILNLAGAEQHPATIDLCCVDLHTGVLEAMKLGAAATFVMGKEGVEILEAGEVPAGVIGSAEPVLLSRKLWDGDRVVMMTDGVLDACPGIEKENVMREYMEGMGKLGPQETAERILAFACEAGEEIKDDMTVLVAGVWKR